MSEIIAQAKYRLHGTDHKGKPYETTVKATLEKSGAFEYGNGTMMVLEWENGNKPNIFDTRYSVGITKNFVEFARQQIDAMTLDTIKVEVI